MAHASNAISGDQKSFLATLCSGNKIIYVDLDLPLNKKQTIPSADTTNKCPLCFVAELDYPSNNTEKLLFSFAESSNKLPAINGYLFNNNLTTPPAIRAPPTLS